MVRYGLTRAQYGVFNVEDQHLEICPVYAGNGDYKGINVMIFSKDKRNRKDYRVDVRRGAIIMDRDILISGTAGYTKNIVLETKHDLGELSIHFGDEIQIEYSCRKK